MIKEKYEFDFLLHEVLRDVTNLRKTKTNHPCWVDDYVLETVDKIQLSLNKLTREEL